MAADADDEQGHRRRRPPPDAHLGAAQLGIAQGVLDAVADGLLEASGDLLVLVAVWVDPAAEDETAVRVANRAAMRKALGVCVDGRDPEAAHALVDRRDGLRSPFYRGQ
jgi:5,6,7,8-tetrahydromethanopterin hydro-lyase